METEADRFSKLESDKMGYDWKVVTFFKSNYPDLLDFMWGNNSPHYQGILKNTISNEELRATITLQMSLGGGRIGNLTTSSYAMIAFRG